MPELPEVETVRKILYTQLIGQVIIDIKIHYEKMIECDLSYFYNSLINKEFKDIKRKGKLLIFELNDIYLLSHLRMEGKFFLKDKDMPILKHEHVIFYLSSGMTLRYHDTRKFGIMTIRTKENLYNTKPLTKIGSEPFDITPSELFDKLRGKNIVIKQSLLDQSIMSGLGNIYVDEVLFLSNINPYRKSSSISLDECKKIIDNAVNILNKAILFGGTTIRSYTSSLNVKGNYQDFLCVHTKEICQVCGAKIVKDKINGRGTYFCPICQKN